MSPSYSVEARKLKGVQAGAAAVGSQTERENAGQRAQEGREERGQPARTSSESGFAGLAATTGAIMNTGHASTAKTTLSLSMQRRFYTGCLAYIHIYI